MSTAIETHELSKRYRRASALTECTVTVPEGRVCALIGPNGAGKTTLLRILAGLVRPSGGTASVLGGEPRQDPAFLADIGFLAQEIPLYRSFTAEDHIRIGAHLNPRWDAALARTRLAELRIPLDQRVGTLSGGQRAQVALALTLAKRPRLLLLDEPFAALDPLARRNFLAALTSAVTDAAGRLTVVLSSHLVTDLERVCDHLILLAGSRVQLAGDIDALLAEQRVALKREDVALEELVLAYMGAGVGRRPPHDDWRRIMTWLVWRQYRAQAAIASALLAALAAVVLVDGFQIASHWHSVLVTCAGNSGCLQQQPTLVNGVVSDLPYVSLIVPVVLGMLWGAPLVASELEARTSDFAWTQSVTRTRWLAVKAGWLLLAAVACGGAVSALTTWWSGPINASLPPRSRPASSTPRASSPSATRCSRWRSASPRAPWRAGPSPR